MRVMVDEEELYPVYNLILDYKEDNEKRDWFKKAIIYLSDDEYAYFVHAMYHFNEVQNMINTKINSEDVVYG